MAETTQTVVIQTKIGGNWHDYDRVPPEQAAQFLRHPRTVEQTEYWRVIDADSREPLSSDELAERIADQRNAQMAWDAERWARNHPR